MTAVANPAVVITTGPLSEARGLTVSSLTSVSVNPDPIVAFNLQVPSQTASALHKNQEFAVNYLPPHIDSAKLCRAMAGQLGKTTNPFEICHEMFHDIHGTTAVKNALMVLYCKKHEVFKVQDHEIWTGRVYKVVNHVKHSATSDWVPMLYQRHQFHSIGPEIEPTEK